MKMPSQEHLQDRFHEGTSLRGHSQGLVDVGGGPTKAL